VTEFDYNWMDHFSAALTAVRRDFIMTSFFVIKREAHRSVHSKCCVFFIVPTATFTSHPVQFLSTEGFLKLRDPEATFILLLLA
jgi:hypothetical protein